MAMSDYTGDEEPQDSENTIEYTAQAMSQVIDGEVKLTINENSFTAAALFDTVEIAFAQVNELILLGYIVTVKADSGEYTFSRLGNLCKPFYDALCDAYNKAVLRSLFIKREPIVIAKGECRYAETVDRTVQTYALPPVQRRMEGAVPVHVYENNVTTLPPNLLARRVPLCFVTGMEKGNFELTLKLDTGESYTYSKLGYETGPFADAVEKQIRKLREKTLAALKEIDFTLTEAQSSQLAKLMPQGAAASLEQIAGIAPSFVKALEKKIAATRAAESYRVFKDLCNPAQIRIGFTESDNAKSTPNPELPEPDDDEEDAGPYVMWMIAPSPDGRYAAVEFATADSATFVYRTGGNFPGFAQRLNRALEAIDFKREVIRLTDSELRKPENADYYMAAKRTSALQFVRANYVGRVIHSNTETWERKLTELWTSQ